MCQELVKIIFVVVSNCCYVMCIIGDDSEGKVQLFYFIDNDELYFVIVIMLKLLIIGVDVKICKLIVLDQNINLMIEFKQIIGCGMCLCEDYQKLYFIIMDFKGVMCLFVDLDFDGEFVVIYEFKDDELVVFFDVLFGIGEFDLLFFGLGKFGEEVMLLGIIIGGGGEGCVKYVIDDVNVCVVVECLQYLDVDGKLIIEDYCVLFKGDIRKVLQVEFGSLIDFLCWWNSVECKQVVLEELVDYGVLLEVLQQVVFNGEELDVFDLVVYVVFDQKLLIWCECVNNVKKCDVFGKYGEQV